MTHFCLLLSELMQVCLDLLGLWLGATEGAVGAEGVGAEGTGAMGAAGVEGLLPYTPFLCSPHYSLYSSSI